MTYSFTSLLPADFEDLSRDLIGAELKIRFEGFTAGPDGGIDGRHTTDGGDIILQAKHYAGSTFATLAAAMRKERGSIDALSAGRYILTTSRPLTPPNKATLAQIIGPTLKSLSDIIGPTELNGLLKSHTKVEQAHIKLWLSSAGVLDRLLNSKLYALTATTKTQIASKVKVFATNPSLETGRKRLEKNHVLIVSGPPGVGKTTLAEMLANLYISRGWEFVAIKSLEDGFAAISDKKKQIFFFDDFLGRIALDTAALAATDSELAMFVRRVSASRNARFILTTRAYLLQEALAVSEHISDPRVSLNTYLLDVRIYTRLIRARILYNHLAVGRTPKGHIRALVKSGRVKEIVDHRNYNPRVVEWMTDGLSLKDIRPTDYVDEFLATLKSPKRLWEAAFSKHIPARGRHLLIALFFGSQYGEGIDDLHEAFTPLHQSLCRRHGLASTPKDFEEGLRGLEGSFVVIGDGSASMINPSLRDYLADYLDDGDLLIDCAAATRSDARARELWTYAVRRMSPDHPCLPRIAGAFYPLAQAFADGQPAADWTVDKIGWARKIDLVLEWHVASRDHRFAEIALTMAGERRRLRSWYDAVTLARLIPELQSGVYAATPLAQETCDAVVECLIHLLDRGVASDDLVSISEEIDPDTAPEELITALSGAVRSEFESLEGNISEMDSESSLTDHMDSLRRLAGRAGIAQTVVTAAAVSVQARIFELEQEVPEPDEPPSVRQRTSATEGFSDEDLVTLFGSLLSH